MKARLCAGLNELLRLRCRQEARRFRRALEQVEKVQAEKLRSILRRNADCVYGRRFCFAQCGDVDSYRACVPLTTYEDYLPYIERMKRGEPHVLTGERVLLFEVTSGSASARKLIPYTAGLKAEFQRGLWSWLYDLYTHCPRVKYGRSYWSITPVLERTYTEGGLPVGFETDAGYFGAAEQYLMRLLFVGPQRVATEMERFYFETCLALLQAEDLALLSVWNPAYLFLLLAYIKAQRDDLLPRLQPRRRAAVAEALETENYERLWPRLAVLSCWCDGHAMQYQKRLEAMFPQALVQPKGLLATECFVTLPLVGKPGAAFSVRSHFFEFRDRRSGAFVALEALQRGAQYEVIVTTSGGLYRYCLRDVVEVVARDGETGAPLVRFKGRADKVSDLYGEKLHELFVQRAVARFVNRSQFYMVAPEGRRYVLYVEGEAAPSLAEAVDNALREAFHYDYCRKLGQLLPLRVFCLRGDPRAAYLNECVRRGKRLGEVKFAALALEGGWERVFSGAYADEAEGGRSI